MLKKVIASAMTAAILLGSVAGLASVSAAEPDVYVVSATAYEEGVYTWLDFELNKEVKEARNFQNTERREEPSDFPDALVDAANKYITWDGETLGNYAAALDSPYVLMCHYEIDKEDKKPYLRILTTPNIISLDKDFVFEIKSGFITADYKKFNPFKATWDSKAQKFTLEQEGVPTGEEPAESTNTPSPSSTTTTKPPETSSKDNTKPPVTSTAEDPADTSSAEEPTASENTSSDTAAEPSGEDEETNVFVPPLGSFDLKAKSDNITIDVTNKKVSLEKAMTVGAFKENIETPDGYVLHIYENTTEITDDKANIRSGATLQVENQGTTIGELVFEVKDDGGSGNLVLIIVLIAVGVILIAGGAVFFFILNRKKA